MDWITWLLLLFALIVLIRLMRIVWKSSHAKNHTIQLTERQPKGQNNPGIPFLWLFLFFLLLASAVAAQIILSRLQ